MEEYTVREMDLKQLIEKLGHSGVARLWFLLNYVDFVIVTILTLYIVYVGLHKWTTCGVILP